MSDIMTATLWNLYMQMDLQLGKFPTSLMIKKYDLKVDIASIFINNSCGLELEIRDGIKIIVDVYAYPIGQFQWIKLPQRT